MKRTELPVSMQESHHCILCSTSNFGIICKKDEWQYLRCCRCGLVYLDPCPTAEEVAKNYQDYLPPQPEEISKWQRMMRPVVVKSADLIEARAKTGKARLLDVGCGYGFFLREMKSRGWQVEGVELSPAGRKYAKDKCDVRIYSQTLEKLCLPENFFDVITLFYVIEHVLDPLALLREVKRILKPHGLVVVRWPHTTPIVKILGPFSGKLDLYHTPYHLYDFSPNTIEKLLTLSGFLDVETSIIGHTRPCGLANLWVSTVFGKLGEAVCLLSGGRILVPGVSKTTLAFKAG